MFRQLNTSSIQRSLLGLAAGLLVVSCGGSDDGTEPKAGSGRRPAPSSSDVVSTEVATGPAPSIFGDELVVNGEVIGHDKIKQHLSTGTLGSPFVELLKLKVYVDEEIAKRKAAGEDVSTYVATDAEIDAKIEEAKEHVRTNYGEEIDIEDLMPTQDEIWLDQVRFSQVFDKVFLPENPYEYGETTVNAINEGTGTEVLLEQMREGWDQRQAMIERGEEVEDDFAAKGLLITLLRNLVQRYLDGNSVVERPEDGIDPKLAAIVNGNEIEVETIWNMIEGRVTEADVRLAKDWFVNTTLARQAIEKAGHWIGDEEAAKLYAEHSDPYKDSPFSIENVALNFKMFPNVGAYKTWYRMAGSYERMIAEEMTDADMMAVSGQRISDLVGQAKLSADVILLSAYNFKKNKWKDNGWEEARLKAEEVMKALVVEGRDFTELMDEYSEFYDPPLPQTPGQDMSLTAFNKGRFRGQVRNDLLGKLSESDFSMFLRGESICDFMFFEQAENEIQGPFKGPFGYYITRVVQKTPGADKFSIQNETHRDLLEQDYVATRLNMFVQELRKTAEVKGYAAVN